ncbi:MAG: hypothetical protein JWO95_529 [Verrucomicrobiales bacterium]|nr:hypothetical protein [Verrucomicrobiales bacterium]
MHSTVNSCPPTELVNQFPIYPDNAFVLAALQRFWEYEVACPLSFFKANHPEFRSSLCCLDGHDAMIFHGTLKVTVRCGFLPQGIGLRSTTFLDELFEADRFYLEKFQDQPRTSNGAPVGGLNGVLPVIKSPPENYGKEDQTTVAAFLPWRGS